MSGYALAIDAEDPDLIYAGCGSGRGFFFSKDAGATWEINNVGLDSFAKRTMISILVDPQDSKRLYAATEGGVMLSDDRGLTWGPIGGTGGPAADPAWRLATGVSGSIYVLLGSFAGPPSGDLLFVTTDRGATWTNLTQPLRDAGATAFNPDDLDISKEGTIFVSGTQDSVTAYYRSDDFGSTFERLAPQNHAVFGRLALDPTKDGRLFVSGSLDMTTPLLVSNDGGDSFTETGGAFDGTIPISLAVSPHPGGRVFYGLFGDLFVSDDNGTSFTKNNSNFTNAYANTIAAGPAGSTCVYGGIGAHNSTYDKRNAFKWCAETGETELGLTDDAYSLSVSPVDETAIVAGTLSSGVHYSVDGGKTFQESAGSPQGPFPSVFAGDDGTVLASGAASDSSSFGIFRSTDKGKTFVNVSVDMIANRFMKVGDRYFAGGNMGVVVSEDNGETWKRQIEEEGFDVTSIVALDDDGQRLLVGTSNGHLRRSSDGGETWSAASAQFAGKTIVASLLRRPGTKIVYAGLHSSIDHKELDRPTGLWVSSDEGVTFTEVEATRSASLGSLLLIDMVWHPSDANVLYAATWGSGVVKVTLP